jgi:hypothetical protein
MEKMTEDMIITATAEAMYNTILLILLSPNSLRRFLYKVPSITQLKPRHKEKKDLVIRLGGY